MTDQNLKSDSVNPSADASMKKQFQDFGKEDGADLLSWYMVVFAFISIAIAGLCIYLRTIHYRDFSLNGVVMGNYFLLLGAALYIGGRAIKYAKRFKKNKAKEMG